MTDILLSTGIPNIIESIIVEKSSSKDTGQRITSITEVVNKIIYTVIINNILKNPVFQLI